MLFGTTRATRVIVIATLILTLCVSLSAKQKLGGKAKRYMRSGDIYWGQENWDKAAENYEQVLAESPDYIEALKKMGDLNFFWGENRGQYVTRDDGSKIHAAPELAIEYYLKSYDYLTRCLDALAIPENQETGSKRDEQLELETDAQNKVKSVRIRLYNLAVNQMKAENYEMAESVASKVIELDPEYINAYTLMANIYMTKGDNAAAAPYMEQAAMKSNDGRLYRNVAALYFEAADYAKAVEWYQKAAEIEPDVVDNYFNMAVTYLRMSDNTGAYGAFAKVVELDPQNIDALTYCSSLASQLDKPEESLMYLEKAIDAQPDNIDWLSTICTKLFNTKDWEKLHKYAEMWHNADGNDPLPVQFLYQAASNLGNDADAKRYSDLYNSMQ